MYVHTVGTFEAVSVRVLYAASHSSPSLLFVSSPGSLFLGQQNRRWRRGNLGWFRVAPQLVPARDLSAPCSMVYQVNTHYSRKRDSPHGPILGRVWEESCT